MPRTLPWLKKSPSSIPPAQVKSEKRQKVQRADSDNDTNSMPAKKRLRAGRLASSSPPPAVAAAPPIEEFMHEGYDRDDIYIMVEDEFHAVARTFTKHLHHAEYERIKAIAKARNAFPASTISRPVDSITAMRVETKKRKEAEARDARNKATLEQLRNPDNPAKRLRSESDSSDLEVKDRNDKHWKGTALQGLMSKSPSRNKNSLFGLRGIKSTTRAAAGYSKAENRQAQSAARTFDLTPRMTDFKKMEIRQPSEASTSDGSETDDLDAPAPKRQVILPQKSVRKLLPTSDSHLPLSTKPPESRTNPQPLHPTKIFSSSHHHDSKSVPPSKHLVEAAQARLKARKESLDRRKEGVVNVNEIPVFLV